MLGFRAENVGPRGLASDILHKRCEEGIVGLVQHELSQRHRVVMQCREEHVCGAELQLLGPRV